MLHYLRRRKVRIGIRESSNLDDPHGRIRLFVRSGKVPATVLNDIKLILAGA